MIDDTTERGSKVGDDLARRPPEPDGIPLLGNTIGFIRHPMSFIEQLSEHGDVVRCGFPMIQAVALFHPEDIRNILLTNQQTYRRWNFDQLRKMGDYDFAPEGLAFIEGEQWRKQRHHLQSMFGLDRLQGYADTMVEHTERVLKRWDDGKEIALSHTFSELSLAVLTHSLFDLDMRERSDSVIRATEALNDRAQLGGLKSVEFLLPAWVPTPGHARYREAMDDFDEIVDELIAERCANPGDYDDLLARILATESDDDYTMSDAEIHDQMLAFLFAGHETTATALTFTWLLLSTHRKARTVRNRDRGRARRRVPFTELFDELTYTEQVIKEALRLYPPAAMLFRKNLTETEIGGYTIPANSTILLPQFVVHTDERWYDDPQTFRPERWDSRRGRPEYAYFPFGSGGHHCIGMRIAMMELKHVVPIIAQHVDFELLSTPDPAIQMEMTLQPTEDIRARITKR